MIARGAIVPQGIGHDITTGTQTTAIITMDSAVARQDTAPPITVLGMMAIEIVKWLEVIRAPLSITATTIEAGGLAQAGSMAAIAAMSTPATEVAGMVVTVVGSTMDITATNLPITEVADTVGTEAGNITGITVTSSLIEVVAGMAAIMAVGDTRGIMAIMGTSLLTEVAVAPVITPVADTTGTRDMSLPITAVAVIMAVGNTTDIAVTSLLTVAPVIMPVADTPVTVMVTNSLSAEVVGMAATAVGDTLVTTVTGLHITAAADMVTRDMGSLITAATTTVPKPSGILVGIMGSHLVVIRDGDAVRGA